MSITYDAGTNTITVTGGTSGTPRTLAEVLAADVAGSWGKVTNPATSLYVLAAHLVVGDGVTSTYMSSRLEQVTFIDDMRFSVVSNATLAIGDISSSWGRYGSSWSIGASAAATWSPIGTSQTTATLIIAASQLIVRNNVRLNFSSGAVNLNRTTIVALSNVSNSSGFFFGSSVSLTVNGLYISSYRELVLNATPEQFSFYHAHNTVYGLYFNANATVTRPLISSSITSDVVITSNAVVTIINPESTIGTPLIVAGAAGELRVAHTVNVTVRDTADQPIEGATVVLRDKDGTQVFSLLTDASGKIAEQTVTAKRWFGTSSTLTEYGPFELTISKAGYADEVVGGIIMDKPLTLVYALDTPSGGGAVIGPSIIRGVVQ